MIGLLNRNLPKNPKIKLLNLLIRRLRIIPYVYLFLTISFLIISNSLYSQIGNCGPVDYYHKRVLDNDRHLDSWYKDSNGPFDYIINLSTTWWKESPDINGWPIWCTSSILNKQYKQSNGAIPGTVCSFAIISCLKYYIYTGDIAYFNMAKKTGDYIIQQDLTPSYYKCYPNFPYAVGSLGNISPNGSGHPNNNSNINATGHIQPDKGAMIGVALLELYKVTNSNKYLNTAINIANCLSKNAVQGTKLNSPWPMRVMADNGSIIDGTFSTNVSFACRLFDELLEIGQTGNGMYKNTRNSVWNWLKTNVIVQDDASKWKNFFEDHSGDEENPLQLNALETARYLLEKKTNADSDWFNLSGKIINQVQKRWALTQLENAGYICIAEQDKDLSPYNSHTARFGSILAMYYEAGAIEAYKDIAYHSLCYGVYSIENNGFTNTYYKEGMGAWTSDSFGDFFGHYIDAFAAIPEWAGNDNHILKSSSTIQEVLYKGKSAICYTTYDTSGTEKLKLINPPSSVTVNGKLIYSYLWDTNKKVLLINRKGGSNVVISISDSVKINTTNSLCIYPNPVTDILTISMFPVIKNTFISIFDIEGRLVLENSANLPLNCINISSLNKGIYIIKISNSLKTQSQKFIKQ